MAIFGRKKSKEEKDSAGVKADVVSSSATMPAGRQEARADKKAGEKSALVKGKVGKPKGTSMKDLYEGKAKSTETSQKKVDKVIKKKPSSGRAYRVLIKPLITEKAAILNTESKYAFSVATDANKIEIANAVEEVYGIKPIAVNIIKVSGKKVRYGRTFGKRKDWKKAIVALPKGKSINIYEGV